MGPSRCFHETCAYGTLQILKDGKYGVLVPVGDHHAMSPASATRLTRTPRQDNHEYVQPFTISAVAAQSVGSPWRLAARAFS